MSKYYYYRNASRRLKVSGFVFDFEVVDNVGGAWCGVLELSDPLKILALETVAPRLGITELTKDEFDELVKKKTRSASFFTSNPPRAASLPAHVGVGPAVVATPPVKAKPTVSSKTAETLVKTGKAEFNDVLDGKMYAPKRSRNPKPSS